METEQERCAKAKQFKRIDDAFCKGDLEGLRAALDDSCLVPNGAMPAPIGNCLVYAIYHSPRRFIEELLQMGADPNPLVNDGFPPLIAALTCASDTAGAMRRTDLHDVLRLLLTFGADPNQRGINDCTPLHIAVAARDQLSIQILLDAGADPNLPTRIDDFETPLDTARSAGLRDIEDMLVREGKSVRRRLRPGLTLLLDIPGDGEPVRRHHKYRIRFRMWLNGGEPVRWNTTWTPGTKATLGESDDTLFVELRIDRRSLVNGLFYGLQGMRVNGTRRLEIAPHLAYGDRGVPGVVPPNAVLTAEITVLAGLEHTK